MSDAAPGPRFAAVAVAVPVRRQFTYSVPASLEVSVGARVRVPFGRRRVDGTVVELSTEPPGDAIDLKPIEAVLDDVPRVPPSLLELARFVSDYYLCSLGEAVEAAMPLPRKPRRTRRGVRRLEPADAAGLPARATARRALLAALPGDGSWLPVERLGAPQRRVIRDLEALGWVETAALPEAPERAEPPGDAEPPLSPTPGQAAVLDRLCHALANGGYAPFVLFGATGSGKTEVYLQAAQATLQRGRTVLYLVPEIGLTPLLLAKIRRRFPGRAAVMHSALPARRRREAWLGVRHGRYRLVVGTRSAVFAPLEDIGLIVVDEEQDGSYKQQESPRYNGRDLAVWRARAAGAAVVLGSATPSMESFHHADAGRYELLRLGARVEQRPLAKVETVDMRNEFRHDGKVTPLSRRLIEALQSSLERGEQALVLRNRRGWSIAVYCPSCGERISCLRCSISLTWHRAQRRLRCHYCEHEEPFPDSCPTCSSGELRLLGEGTEKLEELLRRRLPGARVERMDRDTIRRQGAHESLLKRFERGEIDVLVGTQMIAKGHDFPRVTLVGVISADQSLGLPDFRAGERTFQLLTQVAGRAGRGRRPGTVVVQAFDPGHPVLELAAAQDYEAFYRREIGYRRALRYPPLSALVQIMVLGRDPLQAREWAARVASALRERGGERLIISGPGPAPVERIRGFHRFQILARSAGRRRLVQSVDAALTAVEGSVPRRALQVDVDAIALL